MTKRKKRKKNTGGWGVGQVRWVKREAKKSLVDWWARRISVTFLNEVVK